MASVIFVILSNQYRDDGRTVCRIWWLNLLTLQNVIAYEYCKRTGLKMIAAAAANGVAVPPCRAYAVSMQ